MAFRACVSSVVVTVAAALGAAGAVAAAPLPPAARPGAEVRAFVQWARADRAAAAEHPWAVLDKKNARIYLFEKTGALRASSPVLLGAAVGDDSVPGIGDRKISDIRPFEKTTPAGRFPTEPGTNLQGEDIVWVDYDAAISMHRVRPLKGERRLQRLASPDARDNRISYGCINVPAAFYDRWLKPTFGSRAGILYVMPETRSAGEQFGSTLPVRSPH